MVMSGLADEGVAVEAVSNGAQDYLVKAQDDGILGRAVLYALERRRLERERQIYIAKLEKSNQELQDFAFVASHDLNEPLRKIQAFGDLLMEKSAECLGAQGLDYLTRMKKATGRMQELLDGLLVYSRVTTRANPFSMADLAVIAREAVSDLDMRIEQTGAHVDVEPLAEVEVDPVQIRQLFQNLIGNSLKFHGAAAPRIRIHGAFAGTAAAMHSGANCADDPGSGDACGDSGGACDDACYKIFVQDNGIGFDEAHLERIFKPFQRLHGRGKYEGTGMGLAICRKIVERHGGGITARSAPGKGATFIVTLPVRQPGEAGS